MSNFADRAIRFYERLEISDSLPEGILVMNPYRDTGVMELTGDFFRKYFDDNESRRVLLGINPGRFGAGVTGITFTDPVALSEHCGIRNQFEPKTELSSRFVYEVISAYGGTEKFYSRFFLSAVCPLGFVRHGRNLNYYDDKKLEEALGEFITATLVRQVDLGIKTDIAYSMGEGKNMKFLERLNRKLELFGEIVPLPHPRWVMQYRFKRKEEFIQRYLDALNMV